MQATIGTGPVGTGVFLRVRGRGPDGTALADLWCCVAFLPIVPLSRWQIEQVGQADDQVVDVLVRGRSRIPLMAATWQIARGISGTLLSMLVFAFGVATIGIPWATQPLRSVERTVLQFLASHPQVFELLGRKIHERLPAVIDMVCGAAGMAIETGVFLAGAAIPVLVLMHLDLSTRRVPLRAVLPFGSRPTHEVERAA